MKQRIKLYFGYLLFWIIFFWVSKLTFLLFNFSQTSNIAFSDWFAIYYYGFRLDFASAGYMLLFPGLLIVFTTYLSNKWLYYILSVYTILILSINIFLLVGDLELYTHWKYRLDATPLLYLNKPGEVFGSVSMLVIIRQIFIGLILFGVFIYAYYKWIAVKIKKFQPANWKSGFVFLLITALSFIQMRGGFGLVPMNISTAYFHKNIFVNHATVNLFWNVGNSLIESADLKNRFEYFDSKKANEKFKELYPEPKNHISIIKGVKPNVIFIIVESLTAKVMQGTGGRADITPNLNRLAKEGILFNNFYASGDRSDKGIVAVISGYSALPKTSIMKYPSKTQQLPFISKILSENGYSTAFYYGGDPDFANIKSYLLNGGFNKIISKKDFTPDTYNAKWGVHDHIVLNRFYDDLCIEKKPFFYVLFTLSSHDPFDVPMKQVIHGDSDESKFLNSLVYTDKCIGEFINKASKTAWWKNTLIVFVADHGNLLPGNTGHYAAASFKIPMLWLGGALTIRDSVVTSTASQTDIPASVLAQLNLNHESFLYSSDVFSAGHIPFAFFAFNDGYGFVTDKSLLIFDNNSQSYLEAKGFESEKYKDLGKSYLQVLYSDFISR